MKVLNARVFQINYFFNKGEKNMRYLLLVLLFVSFTSIYGQDKVDEKKVKTKLEEFQAKDGIVAIKGYTETGKIGRQVVVKACEFRDASKLDSRITGLKITVQSASGYESTSFVDSDEIDSLLAGIDYILKVTKEVTVSTLKNFEVEYETKDKLNVTVFNSSNDKYSYCIGAGRIRKETAYIGIAEMTKFRQLIVDAKTTIAELK